MKIKVDVGDGKNVFFISDLHLYHANVIKYDKRPFLMENGELDVWSMGKTIMENWNNVVTQNDVVFNLGDLHFGNSSAALGFIKKLNGTIHHIMGNHDSLKDLKHYVFASINDYVDLSIINDANYKNLHFVLMHYPIYSWNRQHHDSIHLHGHCHGNLHNGETSNYYQNRKVMDVGCNLIDYTPISYKKVLEKFKV
jgi:calcineurin-like phosphoesterase family protein